MSQVKSYYIRFNTRGVDHPLNSDKNPNLRWRLFDAVTHEEQLIESFELMVPLHPVQTFEEGVEKWNVGFTGSIRRLLPNKDIITALTY